MAKEMSQAHLVRMRFIDFMLQYHGQINRFHIEDYFGLSRPQATLDLRMYNEAAPGNMTYVPSKKSYFAGEYFVRKFL